MFVGLDLGTTNVKAVLAEPDGTVVARGSVPVECCHRGGGIVEQDIEEIWSATLAALRGLGEPDQRAAVQAVGISAQGAALQIVRGDGAPAGPVISWMDGRGKPYDEKLTQELGRDWLVRHTGHGRCNLCLGQLARIRKETPGLLAPPNRVGFVGDVIVSRLCGRAAHDATSLSIAWLYNPSLRAADPDVLKLVGIREDQLPDLGPARAPAGGLLEEVARDTGLPAGVPVSPAVHDQYAAALGSGSVHAGDVMFGAGTAWVLLAAADHLAEPVTDGAFVCTHVVDGLYGQMVSMVNGGSVFSWATDLLGLADKPPEELDAMMEAVEPGSAGLRFRPTLAHGGGEGLPPGTRGGLWGVELSHGPAHLLRAVAEGLVLELARYLRLFTEGGVPVSRLIMTGGAAASRVTPQTVADATGRPLFCATETEMSAFGAALLAQALTEPDTPLASIAERAAPEGRQVVPGTNASFYTGLFDEYLEALRRLRGPGASG